MLTRPEIIPADSLALLPTFLAPRAAGWRSGLFTSYAISRVLPADTPLRANILTFRKALGLCEAQGGTCVLTCSLRTSKRRGYHRPSARRIGGCRGRSITKPAERTGRPSTHRRDGRAEICSKIALRKRFAFSFLANLLLGEALFCLRAPFLEAEGTGPDGAPARFRMVLAPLAGGACGLRS